MAHKNPLPHGRGSDAHSVYPGTNLNNKPAHIHLQLLSAGTTGQQYRQIIVKELIPLLQDFKPECLFISAGFDAHRLDPLASLELETEDYGFITEQLRQVADTYCAGKMISTLEGGYHLQALADSVLAHVRGLLGT